MLTKIDGIHVTSTWEKNELKKFGIQTELIRLIYNPIPKRLTKTDFEYSKNHCSTFTFLYVGRLHPYKGISQLLDAYMALPAATLKKTKLKLIGHFSNESYRNKILNKIKSMPPNVQVEVKPFLEMPELSSHYKSADVFVMPSKSENFGLSILEALYFRKQIIVPKDSPWGYLLSKNVTEIVSKNQDNLRDCLIASMNKDFPNPRAIKEIDDLLSEFDAARLSKQFTAFYGMV